MHVSVEKTLLFLDALLISRRPSFHQSWVRSGSLEGKGESINV
jgi:hypothetical protein